MLELADAHDLVVLEDDPYRLVRFEGDDVPSLHELDGGNRVLHSSSFSKIVAPGLRVGYLVVPSDLAAELEAVAAGTYLAPAFSTQAIVFEFLQRGLLEPNVERVCGLLRRRRDALLSALERELPEASWSTPAGGYFLWLELPAGVSAGEALAAGEEAGVTFVAGERLLRPPGGRSRRGAARVQLRFTGGDRRRRRAACRRPRRGRSLA